MKTSMITNGQGGTRRLKFLPGILTGALLLGLVAGCKTTRQVGQGPSALVNEGSYYQPSGFLGDYSELHRGTNGQARLIYIRPNVDWAKYTKIWLKPVELWKSNDPGSPMNKISPKNRQRLINLFYTAMHNTLSTNFTLVEHGGPDVLVVRGAITDAKKSRPVIGAVAALIPQLKIISFGKQALFGTGIGVGMVTIEFELLDGQTGQRLAAGVDSRSGTLAIRSKFSGTWGDVNRSFDWWAARLDQRLMQEKEHSATMTPL